MVGGTLQVTLVSPRPTEATVLTWTLPVHAVAGKAEGQYDDDAVVYIQPRIAEALNVKDGDHVQVEIPELPHQPEELFSLPVKLRGRMSCDVMMTDFVGLGIAEGVRTASSGREEIVLGDEVGGAAFHLRQQNMWTTVDSSHAPPKERRGSARLYFDGTSRDSPNGPCGYGFHIVRGTHSARGDDLVQGYGYAGMDKSSNEMEYHGLIEGLYWAARLDLRHLQVFGLSETIIKQLTGEYSIKNRRLKALYDKARGLMDRNAGMKCNFQRIHREENDIAEGLTNLGIAKKETVVTCHWPNINHLMARDKKDAISAV